MEVDEKCFCCSCGQEMNLKDYELMPLCVKCYDAGKKLPGKLGPYGIFKRNKTRYFKKYYEINRGRILEIAKGRYEIKREEIISSSLKYYYSHRDSILNRMKKEYLENPEKFINRNKRYRSIK